jgi:hypothetical protein
MGAEPNCSLIRGKLVIISVISFRALYTHFEACQRDVFECRELLLVFGESLEESVENMLGRVEALRIEHNKKLKTNTLE